MDLEFDVVDFPAADPTAEGDQAPDFERPLVNEEFWEDRALSDLTAEGPVLLLFHPMAGSFPATYVWKEVREREWDTDERVQVVGCTISTPYAHRDLIAERDVDARLFSDPGNGVAEQYGIAHELDGMAGVSEPRPAVFLVDEDRIVRYAWVAGEWPEFPDYDAVDEAIDALD